MEIIQNNKFSINYVVYESEPWFKAKEVAKILGYVKPRNAVQAHVSTEDKTQYKNLLGEPQEKAPLNIQPHSVFINESGLYSLILSSKKPEAKEFKHWVTSEVLPQIRKTGKYEFKPKKTYITADKCLNITSENSLHYATISYVNSIRDKYNLLTCIGMGEYLDTSAKRQDAWKKGYQSGQPDLLILNQTHRYRGLLIEFKNAFGTGHLSDDQKHMIKKYQQNGFKTIVSNDYTKIVIKIHNYVKQLRVPCLYCRGLFKTNETLKNHLIHFHRMNDT